jgi:hypothetical protein
LQYFLPSYQIISTGVAVAVAVAVALECSREAEVKHKQAFYQKQTSVE